MKSSAEFKGEGFEKIECVETKIAIWQMYHNFSPSIVLHTKKRVNGHLLTCENCRTFFYEKWSEAQKQFAEKKSRMLEG